MIRLALLGDPVAHSKSPVIHRAALCAAGLEGSYVVRLVDQEGMADAAEEVRSGQLTGANITMPHKGIAADLSDSLAPSAKRTHSVNTWYGEGRRLIGCSTDGDGVHHAWRTAGLGDGPVLVLGSGGAAAAALVALENHSLHVSARNPERAAGLTVQLGIRARAVPWATGVSDAVVVNATPVGMNGERLPAAVLAAASGLLDMAYGDVPTPAVELCRSTGVPVADGVDMLVGQAMASFRVWTGRSADEAAIRQALASA